MTVCFPTRCTVTAACVMRPPASAPVNQKLAADRVTDAMRTPTIPAGGVLVSVDRVFGAFLDCRNPRENEEFLRNLINCCVLNKCSLMYPLFNKCSVMCPEFSIVRV